MSCFFMIKTENNKTNLLESLSCYPTTIGYIGVKNGLESLLLSRTIIHSICKRSGIKEWQCQVLTTSPVITNPFLCLMMNLTLSHSSNCLCKNTDTEYLLLRILLLH